MLEPINPYMRIVQDIIKNQSKIIPISTPISPLAANDLDNVDCPECNNTGKIVWKDDNGDTCSKDCKCMKKRIFLRNVKDSGLKDLVQRYTFDNYLANTQENKIIKDKALKFVNDDSQCFVIMGKSGSGKTHICTAITYNLAEKGRKARYFLWRTDATLLKSLINSGERYQEEVKRLRDVDVLYIDDLFKGNISDADVNLAFTLINDRYNSAGKKTIISTELTINDLVKVDEAIAGRIVEMAKDYVVKAPNKNWRMQE